MLKQEVNRMPYVILLLIMGVIFGFLAAPLAQRIGYAQGHLVRSGERVTVVIAL
jgi:hypothetical protein